MGKSQTHYMKSLFSKRASDISSKKNLTKLKQIFQKSVWVEHDKFYIDLLFSFITLDRYNFYLDIVMGN